MENIKVSIIVPVYNVEKYIARCLDSLINQTLKEIEIIIVNDNTPDNSMKICSEYSELDSRIKIFNKENEGLGLTRNYGMKYAKGEFIAFVDSDDFVQKDFYEKLYNSSKKNNSDVCFAEYKIYNFKGEIENSNSGKIPFNKECVDSKSVLYSMLNIQNKRHENRKMGMSVWRAIYKRKIIEEFNISFVSEREYISEDICFNFDVLENCKNVSFVKDTYYYYCYNAISLSHSYRSDRMEKTKNLIRKLKEKKVLYKEGNDVDIAINSLFIEYTHGIIKQEVKNRALPYRNRKKNIMNIIFDKELIEALNNKNKKDLKNEIFDYLIRKKYILLIFAFCRIRQKIKK